MVKIIPSNQTLDSEVFNSWLLGKKRYSLPKENLESEFISAYVCNNIVLMLKGELNTVKPTRDMTDLDLRTVERMGNTAFLSSGFIDSTNKWYDFTRNELISLAYFAYKRVGGLSRMPFVQDEDIPLPANKNSKAFLNPLADSIKDYANLLSDVYRALRISKLPLYN